MSLSSACGTFSEKHCTMPGHPYFYKGKHIELNQDDTCTYISKYGHDDGFGKTEYFGTWAYQPENDTICLSLTYFKMQRVPPAKDEGEIGLEVFVRYSPTDDNITILHKKDSSGKIIESSDPFNIPLKRENPAEKKEKIEKED